MSDDCFVIVETFSFVNTTDGTCQLFPMASSGVKHIRGLLCLYFISSLKDGNNDKCNGIKCVVGNGVTAIVFIQIK